MIGVIVSGHGNFSTGITSSLKLFAGELSDYQMVDFLPEDSAESLTGKIKEAIAELKECHSILVLTDLTGGTPYNVSVKLKATTTVPMEVIGGVNLGALIEAYMGRIEETDVRNLAKSVVESAKQQVVRSLTEEEVAEEKKKLTEKKITKRVKNQSGEPGKIIHARVDERLIHGQVAMVWTNTVGASRIVVVNNEALQDEMILAGLKMAKPAGVKLSIVTVKRAIERFKEDAYAGERIFVITKNIADMAELIKAGVAIEKVNIGNVAKREGSKQIKKSVNLTEKDIEQIKEIIKSGHQVTAQMIPNESDQSILNYLS